MMRTGWCGAVTLAVLLGAVAAHAQPANNVFAGSRVASVATAETRELTLADAIDHGLTYNLGLIALDDQVESARGARLRSLREFLPRVDARAGETRQTTNLAAFGFDSSLFPGVPSIVGPFNIFDARVAASQSVFDRGARLDLASKTSALEAVRLDAQNARETVVFLVTNLYFQVVAGESRVQSARSQVATAEALLTQATSLRDAGAVPGIDVVRAQVQLQAMRQRLVTAENESAKQSLQLLRAIGLPSGQRIAMTDRSLSVPGSTLSLEESLKQAAASRTDYKASLERVRSASAALESTRAGRWPTAHVNADYGVIGSSPGDARRTYAMSAGVRVALFDQDRVGRQVEGAATLRQRQAEADDLVQRIEAEVRAAFLDVEAAEQQQLLARERAALAERELELARIRFAAGVTSNLEVTQAQNEVAAAADGEVAGGFAANVARAALVRAIGGSAAAR